MKVLNFSYNEKTAITISESGLVEIWQPSEFAGGTLKVFSNTKGKSLLRSDENYTWKNYAKKAAYCEYMEVWMGEFPYSSWAWGIRRCLVTGEVTVTYLETEINSRGATGQDLWREGCQTYVPESVAA